jgi:hypothetical protein
VENGYLQRTDNPGRVMLPPEFRERFGTREHLRDGRLLLYLTPVAARCTVGEKLRFKVGLCDSAMAAAVEAPEVELCIAAEEASGVAKRDGPSRAERQKPNGAGASGGLPRVVLLTKDGREMQGYATERWPEAFTELDGGDVVELGDGEAVYRINYDNSYHLRYRQAQRGSVAREVVTEKYILGMRILLLGNEHALRVARNGGGSGGIGEYLDEFRRAAARGAASTVLALAENLPRIVDAASFESLDAE